VDRRGQVRVVGREIHRSARLGFAFASAQNQREVVNCSEREQPQDSSILNHHLNAFGISGLLLRQWNSIRRIANICQWNQNGSINPTEWNSWQMREELRGCDFSNVPRFYSIRQYFQVTWRAFEIHWSCASPRPLFFQESFEGFLAH
jgi:hypothetical protein